MSEWISVDDRLPDNGMVLTYWTDKTIETYEFDILDYAAGWCRPLGNHLITHWMPLPEPPKEQDDE